MVLFMLSEWNNNETIGGLNFIGKMQATFFQAVTLRTAGFGTVGYTHLHLFTIIFMTVFMFIGGSPGGTAGGAKTSTVALVVKLLWAEITGQQHVIYQKRTLDDEIVQRALVIVVMFVILNFLGLSLMFLYLMKPSLCSISFLKLFLHLVPWAYQLILLLSYLAAVRQSLCS